MRNILLAASAVMLVNCTTPEMKTVAANTGPQQASKRPWPVRAAPAATTQPAAEKGMGQPTTAARRVKAALPPRFAGEEKWPGV